MGRVRIDQRYQADMELEAGHSRHPATYGQIFPSGPLLVTPRLCECGTIFRPEFKTLEISAAEFPRLLLDALKVLSITPHAPYPIDMQ